MQHEWGGWDAYRLFCISAASLSDGSSTVTHSNALFAAELQDRLGVVEECISDCEALSHGQQSSLTATRQRQMRTFLLDEAEERRFIEEDVRGFPCRLFTAVSFERVQQLFFTQESEARQLLFCSFVASFRESLWMPFEQVDRLRVTWEALDSLALKACTVGRMGVREGQLKRTSAPGHKPADASSGVGTEQALSSHVLSSTTAVQLLAEEKAERGAIVAARRAFASQALLARAMTEKHRFHTAASRQLSRELHCAAFCGGERGNLTARGLMESSVVRIQSVFRGHRVRVSD